MQAVKFREITTSVGDSDLLVNPSLVSAVGTGMHGKTILTLAGPIQFVVEETVEETLQKLGWTLE